MCQSPAVPLVIPEAFQQGLVSVIIPTFNRGYILGETIASVLSQTYRQLEIIVVDDGSTDNTAALVAGFGDKIRYVRQPNSGVTAARNLGFTLSRGEFVALLDSDDTWLSWKVDAQIAILRAFPEVGMVWSDMESVDRNGRSLNQRYLRKFYHAYQNVDLESVCDKHCRLADVWPGAPMSIASSPILAGDIFSQMFLGNLVHTSTVMLRRERLLKTGLFDVGLRFSGEDYEFHLRTTSHGPVAFLDASSILYRVGADDQLSEPQWMVHIARNNLTTVLRWLHKAGQRIRLSRKVVRQRLAESYAWAGETELYLGNNRQAASHLLRGLRYRPSARGAARLGLCALPPQWFQAARQLRRALRQHGRPS